MESIIEVQDVTKSFILLFLGIADGNIEDQRLE